MLFNSPVYLFLFLPFVLASYFLLNQYRKVTAAKVFLVVASLFFYAYWKPIYLPLILFSILVNYGIGSLLNRSRFASRWLFLALGLVFNLGLLGYFKYADFFITNGNSLLGSHLPLLHLALPLAISFFTFQQVAYLMDCYSGETKEYDFMSYCLFVTFFPQLIAGPIVHHKEMMPQFSERRNKFLNWRNVYFGLCVFIFGLFKKVVVADTFSVWANAGFGADHVLTLFEAWAASLSYTFQLYYDFSGYSDMAIGAALMFNIRLPINFNSPYKAVSIQDFWRRWHMTLSRWLRDYLYIPLGGNRKGHGRTYLNVIFTMFLGGLWHGAGWTFVAWGTLHGVALAFHRLWQKAGYQFSKWTGWVLTFLFVNFAWVLFRAESFSQANSIYQGMFGLNGVKIPAKLNHVIHLTHHWPFKHILLSNSLAAVNTRSIMLIAIFALVSFTFPNSLQIGRVMNYEGKLAISAQSPRVLLMGSMLFLALMYILSTGESEFLYFNF